MDWESDSEDRNVTAAGPCSTNVTDAATYNGDDDVKRNGGNG